MDDFNLHNLTESRNEYSALLISKLSPHIFEGIRSIFKEAYDLCKSNDETEKYLMTFQNFLSRVSKWNQELINVETERISSKSNCSYLEDLLSCVYINQLKILTTMRVGSKQKQIDIDIPKLNDIAISAGIGECIRFKMDGANFESAEVVNSCCCNLFK